MRDYAYWVQEIEREERLQKPWIRSAEKAEEVYRDEPKMNQSGSGLESKKYNVLWSNTETLKPAVYLQPPKTVVARRYKDKNPLGLKAAMVLQRAIEFELEEIDFDIVVEAVVEDLLIPGRGDSRVLYKADIVEVPVIGSDGNIIAGEDGLPLTREELANEKAFIEYSYWKDVLIPKTRGRKKPGWRAYIAYLDRKELVDRFGPEIGNKIKLDAFSNESQERKSDKAKIYEIWSKNCEKVYWLSKSHDDFLDADDPPLSFKDFYPSPDSLCAVKTNSTNITRPLFAMYRYQANEINELTDRIAVLQEAVQASGFYDASQQGLANLLGAHNGGKNQMIPISEFEKYAEKGGIKNIIDFFPVQEIVNAIQALYQIREQSKSEVDEITGIADIVRGLSNPNETLGAQKIKGRFASLRLDDLRKKTSRYVRDMVALLGEAIAENYSKSTLEKITGFSIEDEVYQLLRNEPARNFTISIETDSTIKQDEEEDKASRIEFLRVLGEFLSQAITVTQSSPALTPLLGEMVLFAVRGFRVGREMEQKIEETIQQLSQMQQQAQSQPPPPDFKAMEAQAKTENIEAKTEEIKKDSRRKDAELVLQAEEVNSRIGKNKTQQVADIIRAAT